ncbi:unnamed protein product [Rotaria magnacalcarata]|uniref:Uncharacterized protein n=2 Tax=Rotaria magnacalcarata TaxID=392030 RepID=A0A816E602_9BILA|nr:unnamed protein product [Rotaria magnacalcarata]
MDCWNRVKRKVPARRTVARFSFALLLLWLCHQRVVKLGFIQMTHHGFALSDNVATTYSSIHYDPLKANLGLIFFRHLIHDSDSHEHVNDENLCSLIHFFIQQATLNKRPVQFSTGIFILYDSTGRFFPRLMMAKNAQIHSDEHRSGYMLRLKHFALDAILSIRERFLGRRYSNALPFIYLRGDESSHFHERGTKYERRHVYPAYGADIRHGCLPNHFGHILFGQLKSLSESVDPHYRGDRIYMKPEAYGLQQFPHYIAHAGHYIRSKLQLILCQWADSWNLKFCLRTAAFHEWTDRIWIKRWEHILSTMSHVERRPLRDQASLHGIQEMYRQTLQFPTQPDVEKFRTELEHHYGSDVSARKGNEIILTTEELLNSQATCD